MHNIIFCSIIKIFLSLFILIWVLLKVLTPQLHRAVQHVPGWRIGGRPGLTLRQNKHVPTASRAKGVPQKSGHMAIYFISCIFILLDTKVGICITLFFVQ
jgi:hypothetical protein